MKKRILIDYLSQPTIGLNQSGMKSQIDTLYNHFKNDYDINVDYYNIWVNRNPEIIHYFGMGEGMINLLKKHKSNGTKIICSPNHWPSSSIVDKLLMKINFRNIIYTNRHTKKYLIDNADLFIVNSNAEKKMFIDYFKINSERIEVIHNSYGDEPVYIKEPIFRNKYQVKGSYALMAGQIGSLRKNQLLVIKNWKINYPNLLILGGFDNTPYGRECMSEINKKNNIKYLGYENDPLMLESAYQNCDVFISPGLIETPSLSAFRALINGVKVCSTNGGDAPQEYFGGNAKYFNPKKENEFVNCIESAFNSNNWTINFSELQSFSNENISNRYKGTYLKILK